MSVRKDSFIMFGWRLPFDIVRGKYDDFEAYYPKGGYGKPFTFNDDFTIIADGMCGNYVVLGLPLASNDPDGDLCGNDGVLELKPPGLHTMPVAAMRYCAAEFFAKQGIDPAVLDPQPKLYLVENYH